MKVKTTRKNNIVYLKNCQVNAIDTVKKLISDLDNAIEESINMFLDNAIDLASLSEVFTEAISIFSPNYKLHDCSICGCEDQELIKNERVDNDYLCQECWKKLLEVPVNTSLDTCIEEDEVHDDEFDWGELFDRQVINNG